MRKVRYARLQVATHIPELGGLPTQLPPSDKTIPNFSMSYDGTVLLVSGRGVNAAVPLGNVQVMVFAEEEPSTT